ncbi:putative integral membrane protein, putative [Indibacter alkaliphilus LW1]|uniref:Integral membrane protein, putative n=1 Tax=Indibacter alkaliphilus (strain CCUG 57479 / KCTC 22604 / LW1) TaxID=1189612 RepID=S2DIL4_INDAL|nr:hypothetical protein [Indibacter alkaliphilus]EOZ97035.1 putative integral membrane protein, putative [Indibacter alkaliphilus LW1]
MNYYFYKALLIFIALPFLISQRIPQARVLPLVPTYQESLFSGPKKAGILENKTIDEASGLAFSQKHENLIYTHNDSGGDPIVFMIDNKGKSQGQIVLEGASNRDWEDIAVGPGPTKGQSYVYVGEIGDNNAVYPEIKIFRFAEPSTLQAEIKVKPEVLTLVYPDGPRDAETLMVDPLSDDIFILSKRDSSNVLYKTSRKNFGKKEKIELEKVMKLDFTMSVAGDISVDGSQILIKNYLMVFYWTRNPGESIPEALSRKPAILPYKPEPQGEAIGFHTSGKSYFTLSEKRFNVEPTLYRYDKK